MSRKLQKSASKQSRMLLGWPKNGTLKVPQMVIAAKVPAPRRASPASHRGSQPTSQPARQTQPQRCPANRNTGYISVEPREALPGSHHADSDERRKKAIASFS